MKKALLLLVLFFVSMVVTGCDDSAALSVSHGCGVVDDAAQRRRRIQSIADINARMITDDSDMFWFADNNLHLSPWYVSYGVD